MLVADSLEIRFLLSPIVLNIKDFYIRAQGLSSAIIKGGLCARKEAVFLTKRNIERKNRLGFVGRFVDKKPEFGLWSLTGSMMEKYR